MLADVEKGMNIHEVQEEAREISKGSVVIKDGVLFVVDWVKDGRVRAIREDGVEVVASQDEFTLLGEEELFEVLEARLREREGKQLEAIAPGEGLVEEASGAKREEKPLPPLVGGWYRMEQYGYEIAPGLKITGLQVLKARYESSLKAFVNVRLNGALTLHGFRILKGNGKPSLLPPQRRGQKSYFDIVELEGLPRRRLEALVLRLAHRLGII